MLSRSAQGSQRAPPRMRDMWFRYADTVKGCSVGKRSGARPTTAGRSVIVPTGRPGEPRQEAQQGGLARAVGTGQLDHVAGSELCVNPLDDGLITSCVAEGHIR